LLDERRGRALIDAGLQQIDINVGEIEEEYESIYKLPWERTLQNILSFRDIAGDSCRINIVLVNHRRDWDHVTEVRKFWQSHGFEGFLPFTIMNRGGSLFVDHISFEADEKSAEAARLLAEASQGTPPPCAAPFVFPFIGYDGQYYLCCSDWTKQTPMGSVIDTPLADVTLLKLEHATDRQVVCKTCNLDPLNLLTENLKAEAAGEPVGETSVEMVERLADGGEVIADMVDQLRPLMSPGAPTRRKLIPVEAR
jgi:hypothetical protein